jgi:hypothetical protein
LLSEAAMVRTQIQIPDRLYREVKRVTAEREVSLAELARRGLEYMVKVSPPVVVGPRHDWILPSSVDLGGPPLLPEHEWRLLANTAPHPAPASMARTGKRHPR